MVTRDAAAVCNGLVHSAWMLIKEVEPSVVRNRQTAVTGVIGHAILGDHDLGRRIIPLILVSMS